MIYVVDLDDTLVSSTQLNNDSYNFALEQYNHKRLPTNERITREKLNFIESYERKDIIELKQKYFTDKWLPYRVVLNKALIEKLIINQKSNCYLWTKADKNRANKIIDYCKLDKYFKDIIFDDKESFNKSILRLSNIVKSNQFIIYENNSLFFANQNCKIVDEIKNKFFNIKGYLVG